MVSKLERIFANTLNDENEKLKKEIEAGRERCAKHEALTRKVFKELEFLNKYGKGLYVSVEKNTGWHPYGEDTICYIRMGRPGYIEIKGKNDFEEMDILVYNSLGESDVGFYGKKFKTLEAFVEWFAKR